MTLGSTTPLSWPNAGLCLFGYAPGLVWRSVVTEKNSCCTQKSLLRIELSSIQTPSSYLKLPSTLPQSRCYHKRNHVRMHTFRTSIMFNWRTNFAPIVSPMSLMRHKDAVVQPQTIWCFLSLVEDCDGRQNLRIRINSKFIQVSIFLIRVHLSTSLKLPCKIEKYNNWKMYTF
jgi:hypothetical protein